jgi:hypothetical protein
MTLRFIDGFEHYAIPAQLGLKYTIINNTQIGTMTGRRAGSTALKFYNGGDKVALTLDDQSTWIVGFAFYTEANTSSGAKVIQFVDSASAVQLSVNLMNGIIQLYRGDNISLLATAAQALQAGVWNYFEVKATIADSGGTFEVRINEQVWVTYSGDTKYSSGLSTARTIRLGCASWINTGFHDLYMCDGTGSTNNAYLGDVRVDTVRPVGAGALTQFLPQGGSLNWENVDDTTSDGDTTYNSSDTAGQIDTFDCGNLAAINSVISGVQANIMARKDDAGTRTLRALTRIGSTNYEGADIAMASDYFVCRQIWEKNPATVAAWAEAEINAAEFGYKVQA